MKESALIKAILAMVKARRQAGARIKAVKIHGSQYSEAGTPDIFICADGRLFALEAKVGKGKTTPIQDRRLQEWRDAGAVVGVVRSVGDVERLLDDPLFALT